jgi:hypothetical protein
MATKSKIHIKPSKRGTLRKAMGAKKGEKLSVSAMKKKMKSASPAMRKKLNFAINARKWKHDLGGHLDISNLDLTTSFAQMNNLPQSRLLDNGLAPTNNTGGKSGGLNMSFDPISLGLNAITAIGGSLGANMAAERAEMYEDASENMQTVDVNKAMKGSGVQAFLQNPLSLGIGGRKRARQEAEEFNENMKKQRFAKDVSNRFSAISQAPTYTPVARQGGFIAYKGQTHEGPDGGILVDKFGNPTAVSQGESVASVEGGGKNKKGEVSYYDPETGSTYIYSDTLKFAKPANALLNKYKLNKPESLQYQQYKNDILVKTMVDKKFENLTTAQEFAKENKVKAKDAMKMFEKGGTLPTKRKVLMPKKNLEYDRDLRMNVGWMDSLNKTKDLNELYNTPVGSWKGNPMTLQQFTEMPEYVTDYYNPSYAIEFNKNRLGLPNTFQDINLGLSKGKSTDNMYQPASTFVPGNEVEYYKKGGYVPMYAKGKDNTEEPKWYPNWVEKLPDNSFYLNDKTKRLVYPGLKGSINPDPFITNEALNRIDAWKKARSTYKPTTPLGDMAQDYNVYWGEPSSVLFNRTDAQYKNKDKTPDITVGPLEKPRLSTKQVKGSGKPTTIRKENILPNKVDYPEFNMPIFYKEPYAIRNGLQKGPTIPEQTNLEEYGNSWLNPAGHLLSATGALADYAAMRKARPENVNLGRVGAERISLAKQRLSNERNAATARAMAISAARSSGMNAGVALSNTTAANTGTNRLLGQQNAELLEREETANAQMRQQANMVNAELAAQEGLFNTQQQNAYRMMMAQNNPLGNMARTAASYFADNAAYQLGYDTLQMLAPNAELYRDPDDKFLKRTFGKPKVRLRDKTL